MGRTGSSALSREKIVSAAMRVLDKVGYAALTTRLVAKELGVQQPALYWHFKNKRELADAMAAAMLAADAWPGPHTPGLAPEDWLVARAHAFRKALLAHRDGALLHAGTTPGSDNFPRIQNQVAALVDHGLTPNNALRLTLAVSRYTVGWVLEEQAIKERGIATSARREEAISTELQNTVKRLSKSASTANFDFGLRAMIEGVLRKARVR